MLCYSICIACTSYNAQAYIQWCSLVSSWLLFFVFYYFFLWKMFCWQNNFCGVFSFSIRSSLRQGTCVYWHTCTHTPTHTHTRGEKLISFHPSFKHAHAHCVYAIKYVCIFGLNHSFWIEEQWWETREIPTNEWHRSDWEVSTNVSKLCRNH